MYKLLRVKLNEDFFLSCRCADINECTTIPGICANGGRCINSYGSYLCFCNSGFYGTNCEIYQPCLSSQCINGGSCISIGNYPYWQCICPVLYTGKKISNKNKTLN